MADVVKDVLVKVGAKGDGSMGQVFGALKQQAQGVGQAIAGIKNQIFSLKGLIVGAVTGGIVGSFIKAGAEAEATEMRFKAVFGHMGDEAMKWANDVAKATGRTGGEIQQAMASFQEAFAGMGLGTKAAAGYSKQLTEMAHAMARARGVGFEQSMWALRMAMMGNERSLRTYGVRVSEADVKNKLLAMGIKDVTKEATQEQMALARMQAIMEKMGPVMEQAKRTGLTWVEMFRLLWGQVGELREALGGFIVKNETLRGVITRTTDLFREWAESVKQGGYGGKLLTDVVTNIGKAMGQALDSFAGWVKGGGPARVLDTVYQTGKALVPVFVEFAKGIGQAAMAFGPLIKSVAQLATEHPRLAASMLTLWKTGSPVIAGAVMFADRIGPIAETVAVLVQNHPILATSMTGLWAVGGKLIGGLMLAGSKLKEIYQGYKVLIALQAGAQLAPRPGGEQAAMGLFSNLSKIKDVAKSVGSFLLLAFTNPLVAASQVAGGLKVAFLAIKGVLAGLAIPAALLVAVAALGVGALKLIGYYKQQTKELEKANRLIGDAAAAVKFRDTMSKARDSVIEMLDKGLNPTLEQVEKIASANGISVEKLAEMVDEVQKSKGEHAKLLDLKTLILNRDKDIEESERRKNEELQKGLETERNILDFKSKVLQAAKQLTDEEERRSQSLEKSFAMLKPGEQKRLARMAEEIKAGGIEAVERLTKGKKGRELVTSQEEILSKLSGKDVQKMMNEIALGKLSPEMRKAFAPPTPEATMEKAAKEAQREKEKVGVDETLYDRMGREKFAEMLPPGYRDIGDIMRKIFGEKAPIPEAPSERPERPEIIEKRQVFEEFQRTGYEKVEMKNAFDVTINIDQQSLSDQLTETLVPKVLEAINAASAAGRDAMNKGFAQSRASYSTVMGGAGA